SEIFSISESTITLSRVVPRLDALPQITAAEGAAHGVAKPFLHPVDLAMFAAEKANAKALRFIPEAGTSSDVPPPQTVSPPEAMFNGISNTTCTAVNGGQIFRPSDMALAVGNTSVGVLQGVNDCVSVFDKNGVQQAGFPKSSPTFFGVTL